MNSTCFDFLDYSDNTVLGWDFTINDVEFEGLGKGKSNAYPPFVNETGNLRGLQFSNNGIEIRLSRAVSEISLDVGSFTSKSLTITAYDSHGNIVAEVVIPGDNDIHSVSLVGNDITSISITGGGGEGVLFDLCSYAVKIKRIINEHLDPKKVKEELENLLNPDDMPEDVRKIIDSVDLDLDSYIEKTLQDIIDYYDRPLEDILSDPRLKDFESILNEIEMEQGDAGDDSGNGNSSENDDSLNGISLGGSGFGLSFKIDWEFLRCFFGKLAYEAFIGYVADLLTRIDPLSGAKEKVLSWAAKKLGMTVALLEKAILWISIGRSIYVAWFLCHKER